MKPQLPIFLQILYCREYFRHEMHPLQHNTDTHNPCFHLLQTIKPKSQTPNPNNKNQNKNQSQNQNLHLRNTPTPIRKKKHISESRIRVSALQPERKISRACSFSRMNESVYKDSGGDQGFEGSECLPGMFTKIPLLSIEELGRVGLRSVSSLLMTLAHWVL